ncbi:MAG TPA: histidine phosphatase family protein [Ilumatobacteraceae bacterium]|nr:histidine phosphatase family protein [Ilumatobacteraceae bacterium]
MANSTRSQNASADLLCDTAVVLILVRHGRTPANAAGLLQGRLDQDLDAHGEQQALAVARYVEGFCEVDAVVSSPLRRAVQTAAAFGRAIELDDRWMELSYGEYEGTPHADVPAEVWKRWRENTHFTPVGGESLATLDLRVRAGCDDLLARASSENVVVVSHVSPIKSAVAWALGVGIDISFNCHLDQAAVCRIAIRAGRPILQTFNETAPVAIS